MQTNLNQETPEQKQKKKQKRVAMWVLIPVGALVWISIISSIVTMSSKDEAFNAMSKQQQDDVLREKREAKEKEDKEEHREEIMKLLSGWDGSNRAVTEYLKQTLYDPDSYEHIETRMKDAGDHVELITTFRAKNAFGAKIIKRTIASVSLDNELISIKYLD